jgi:uncharacterized membrane protein
MNPAQLHLALNHLPIGFVLVGVPMLAIALFRSLPSLKTAACTLIVLASLTALPVYFSGEPAEEVVEELASVSEPAIHEHEEAAEWALILIECLGVLVLALCLLEYRSRKVPRSAWIVALFLGLMSTVSLIRTAHLGGLVHHQELRPASDR